MNYCTLEDASGNQFKESRKKKKKKIYIPLNYLKEYTIEVMKKEDMMKTVQKKIREILQ